MFKPLLWWGLGGVVCIAASHPHHPLLVWNASASVPIGLYRVIHDTPRRGALALVATPPMFAALAAARGYVPLHVPLIKRVAAMSGDQVCAWGDTVSIDGGYAIARLARDSKGRPLPRWNGCRVFGSGEVFLLNADVPHSFDGRYFGPVPVSSIAGILTPLWTR